MAAVAVERAMNLDGSVDHVHPFFGGKQKRELRANNVASNEDTEEEDPVGTDGEVKDVSQRRAKRNKRQEFNGQQTIFQGFGIKDAVNRPSAESVMQREVELSADLEADPNHARRKRLKTASPEPLSTSAQVNGKVQSKMINPDLEDGPDPQPLDGRPQLEAQPAQSTTVPQPPVEEESVINGKKHDDLDVPLTPTQQDEKQSDDPSPLEQARSPVAQIAGRPTRQMRLKGGKLASPIPKKQESPRLPRGGRRAKATEPASLIAKVNYASKSADAKAISRQIDGIMSGEIVHKRPDRVQVVITTPAPSKASGPLKPTHPFFHTKAKLPEQNIAPETVGPDHSQQSPRKASTTTPGKLRAQRDALKNPAAPLFGLPYKPESTARKSLKHLGEHPAWPTHENTHVRGLDSPQSKSFMDLREHGFTDRSAKRKAQTTAISEDEGILQQQLANICLDKGCLRRPTKVVLTGSRLQEAVAEHVSFDALEKTVHPAIASMYRQIEFELTAFDKYECEPQAWAQKYAPQTAAEVLQSGKEVLVLKDWLQRSTISAVQTSNKPSTPNSTISTSKIKKRKRRELSDFIVESDEGDENVDELLPLSDPQRRIGQQRSDVRGGDDYAISTPASSILISGPNGCGKTAAVYAVAKELGFQVFEINSASRRSGKDILDKVGDMTENHLVQQVSKALKEDKLETNGSTLECIKINEPDAPNPKQKSMASFFKAGPTSARPVANGTKLQMSIVKTKDDAKPQTRQQQSLILLEEVDVLFEEDRQFWLTVLALAEHSKRPIVMTCNDERLVPEALTHTALHAILRFVPPPTNLATDYLLFLAAREGHILQRHDVESLYQTKGLDLRASITELSFWCQMGVGDPAKGFNWMLDRYPPGIDVDEDGRTLRTASEGTFTADMHVVCADFADHTSRDTSGEAIWAQAWCEWQIDATDCVEQSLDEVAATANAEYPSFDVYYALLNALSDVDVCSGRNMRSSKQQRLDCTMPPLRQGDVSNYMVGGSGKVELLEDEPAIDFTGVDQGLAAAARGAALKHICESEHTKQVFETVEHNATSSIHALSRDNFLVLDPLATDFNEASTSSGYTMMSSFDREFRVITTDLAPYARIITHTFQKHEERRLRMSNLLSQGGRRRQTRNAFAALDGARRNDRRARYFESLRKLEIDVDGILETGGREWSSIVYGEDEEGKTGTGSIAEETAGTLCSTQESNQLQ